MDKDLRTVLSLFSAPMDTNLLSNIHKLFSERVEIFSPVEFNKVGSEWFGRRALVPCPPSVSLFIASTLSVLISALRSLC